MSFKTLPLVVNSFIRLLHYFVQQSVGVVLDAAEVLHDGIEGAELHGLGDKEVFYYANVTNLLQYIRFTKVHHSLVEVSL